MFTFNPTMLLVVLMENFSFSMPPPSNTSEVEIPSNSCSLACGLGTCVEFPLSLGSLPSPICICTKPYISTINSKCSYTGKSKLAAFLLSFFVGGLGVDWFYLSTGDAGYIAAGIFKLITFSGLVIWWLVGWIRILADAFSDGMGMGWISSRICSYVRYCSGQSF